jgi:hypothetical protein
VNPKNKNYTGKELETFSKAKNFKKYWSSIFKARVKDKKILIEVGSGLGSNVNFLKDIAKKYIGIEPDTQLCSKAKSSYETETFINGDMDDLKNSQYLDFDVIAYIDVLEHIERDYQELEIAVNKLCVNGYILIMVPAHQYLFSNFDKSVGHFRRYSVENLLSIMPINIKCLEIKQIDIIGYLIAYLINKTINPKGLSSFGVTIWDKLIPISKVIDRITGYKIGKSIIFIGQKVEIL